ncbi:hypothetical protein SAMN05660841_04115 [Sphingobacterium nematocida]|uniref:Immunity protein 50 n=1 Tax=Sphingobacterium nematocida TaxID=1513896 RepID=A0A1T5GIY8_9SPHI|nr:hypothetical protein [Sphingobacterium nematocida]SKC08361.1 hypothetical protein SAMN05660841_04115 [Sphingobacterium nematocida]
MLNDIIDKYEGFSDALISEVSYSSHSGARRIEVAINCMNTHTDYQYEQVKLIFIDVLSFRFIESENQSSLLINQALICELNGTIVFDFFPLVFGGGRLEENANSDLMIKCKNVSYESLT